MFLDREIVKAFGDALRALSTGDLAAARSSIASFPSEEDTRRFLQQEWARKKRDVLVKASSPRSGKKQAIPLALRVQVYARDHFTCRHCGRPVIVEPVFEALSHRLPNDFPYHPYWKQGACHSLVRIFAACADHVEPQALGGGNTADNLVTACALCNYVKVNLTLRQLGWEDPRTKIIPRSDWRGLGDALGGFCRSNWLGAGERSVQSPMASPTGPSNRRVRTQRLALAREANVVWAGAAEAISPSTALLKHMVVGQFKIDLRFRPSRSPSLLTSGVGPLYADTFPDQLQKRLTSV